MSDLDYPSDLRYTSDHEWVREGDEDNVVRVGITSFAQDALGDVVYVSPPAVGDSVAAPATPAARSSRRSPWWTSTPLAGEVTAVQRRSRHHARARQLRPVWRGLDVRAAHRGPLGAGRPARLGRLRGHAHLTRPRARARRRASPGREP